MNAHILAILSACLFIACSGSPNDAKSDVTQEDDSQSDDVQGAVNSDFQLAYKTTLTEYQHAYLPNPMHTESQIDSSYEGDYLIRIIKTTANDIVPQLQDFGVNDNILWVGQILDGDAFYTSHTFTPINLIRSPMVISLSLEGSTHSNSVVPATSLSQSIESPNLSNVREAIRNLVTKNATSALPTEFMYEHETIYSEDQLQLGLSSIIGVNTLSQALGIDWKDTKTKTRMIFTFKQRAFSVDMNTPDSVFSSMNSISSLEKALTGSHSPVYVSSVDYGCVFYMVVESDMQESALMGALNLTTSNANAGTQSISSNTKIRVAQFGGATSLHDQLTEAVTKGTGIPQIQNILQEQTVESTHAVPISYQLRYLMDNTVAQVALASEYSKKVYLKVNQKAQITLTDFNFLDTDGAGSPEGYSSVNFYANYKDETGTMRQTLLDTWNGGVSNTTPNKTIEHTFVKFNPATDYFTITVNVTEEDAFTNDHASGSSSFKIADWDGTDRTIDAAGNGAASRITLHMELVD